MLNPMKVRKRRLRTWMVALFTVGKTLLLDRWDIVSSSFIVHYLYTESDNSTKSDIKAIHYV